MESTRREFIRSIGIALASLLAMRCGGCYAPAPLPPTPLSPITDPLLGALRECWVSLGDARLRSFEDTDFSVELRRQHSDTLDALVSRGDLDVAVADEIGIAFDEAVNHIQRQMATCYIALPPEFAPRQDLIIQAALLEDMAVESDIDPKTIAQVEAALQKDIAWLAEFESGETPGALDEVEVGWASAEAARILIEVLLGGE